MSASPGRTGGSSRLAGRPSGAVESDTAAGLVGAALEVFADVGYEAATTRAILATAGVTAPVLYHHFGNKAGLFGAVAFHVNHTVVDALRNAVAIDGDLTVLLRAALERSATLQAENRALVRFLAAAPLELRNHPDLRGAARDLNGVLEFFTELCVDHAPPGVDAKDAARAARVVLHGLARVAATSTPGEFRRTVHAVSAMFDGPPFRHGSS